MDLQRDLEATIAHVVGQGVVALSAGCEIHLAVNPHPSGKHFEGSCWVRNPHGDLCEHQRRLIALAGCVATLAIKRGSPEEVEAIEVFDKLQSGEITLSAADAAMAEGFTLADVESALDTLRPRWALVVDEVARMSPQILNNVTHLN